MKTGPRTRIEKQVIAGAMAESLDGKLVDWLEKVSAAEYLQPWPARPQSPKPDRTAQ